VANTGSGGGGGRQTSSGYGSAGRVFVKYRVI
jgi:hypothetical protein